MTLQEFTAQQTREIAHWLAHSAGRMPAERLAWRPLDNGRNAIEQLIECAYINTMVASALREKTAFRFDHAESERFGSAYGEPAAALTILHTSTTNLAAAIEAFPTDRLANEFETPWGIGKKTFAWMAAMPYWNMTYHLGQINYIQTLYGDREM